MKIFFSPRLFRNWPLSGTTLFLSTVIHFVIFLVLPNLTEQRELDRTTRDLKFLLEELFTTDEKVNIPSDLKSDRFLNQPRFHRGQPALESEKETPLPPPVTEIPNTNPLPPWIISPRLEQKTINQPSSSKNEPSNKQLSPEKAQVILKELEKEFSLQTISDKNSSRRAGPDKKYIEKVHDLIQAKYFVPPKAKTEKMFGRVVLQLTISTDGTIKKITFLERSDFPLLDRAAHTAVENAAPFPNIKDKVDLKELVFIVPFLFE